MTYIQPLLSIDPGASGGLAWLTPEGVRYAMKMPATQGEILSTLRDFSRQCVVMEREPVCYLELVSGFIKGNPAPGSAMFSFGEGYGFLKGCVMALGMKLIIIRPQKWTQFFELGTKSACPSRTVWKNKLKAEAERRFPNLGVTLSTADALLILDYARVTYLPESKEAV